MSHDKQKGTTESVASACDGGVMRPEGRGPVYEAIDHERRYQNAKWGSIEERPHTVGEWLLIIEGELEEAKQASRSWQA